jgi:RIO kinase 1
VRNIVRQKWKEACIDKSELKKVWGGIFDNITILTINKLMEKKIIGSLLSLIKQGKESKIVLGLNTEGEPIIVKIYGIEALNFKKLYLYISGDDRFKNIKQDRRSVVYAWCKKEFANTSIAYKSGVACPRPEGFLNNVYVMSFIGKRDSEFVPAPKLADIEIENSGALFEDIVSEIKKFYSAGLVHGDLSEYNILYHEGKAYIIDWSHSVLNSHPNAEMLLKRDVENICRFFKKEGVACSPEEVMKKIKEQQ